MSVIQFLRQHKSAGWKAGLALLLVLGLYAFYSLLLSPTKIALVNFPSYQVSNIAMANDSRLIKVIEVKAEDASSLKSYDAILLFGPGLRLTEEQTENIETAGKKGTAVYTFVFSSGSINNHHVDSLQEQQLDIYYNNRSRKNYRNMLHYIRSTFDSRKLFQTKAGEPLLIPSDIFFHLEDGVFFRTANELTNHLREKKLYKENAPRIAFVSGMTSPLEGNRSYIDSLITRLTDAGFNVYPIASAARRQELMESVHPDAVVYLPMGRLGGDKTVEWLTENNIPLFCPLSIMLSRDEWLSDDKNKGVTGGYLTARIVLPEIDGGIDPLVISTQNQHPNGYFMFDAESERLDNFTRNVKNYLQLRNKPNKEKRLAICYFKAAGQASLVAAGLEVAPSLYELLKRLKQEGYQVDGLPDTFNSFNQLLKKQGAVLGAYAKGAQDDFMKNGNPLWVGKSTYEQWASQTLVPEKYKEVVDKYGEAPGDYLSTTRDGEPSLAIARLQFGNVVLFPQPHAAEGDDEFQIVHGASVAPPHAYLAPYLWVQNEFKADALIHFGTHGSLEFTPGKQAGLSNRDWPDCLIGSLPHFYYYSIANVGEAIIAKRRTHAVMLSHLTPPFMESRTRGRFSGLFSDIDAWYQAPESKQQEIGLKIKASVLKLGLQRDLQLDSIANKPYTTEEIERIENFAEEIANEKMTGRLYTLGQTYTPEDIESTVIAMSADPLAYSLARLDALNGKITRKQLENNTYISRRYLTPVKSKLKQLLASPVQNPERLMQDFASLSRADLMKARATDMAVNPRQLSMSEMMAMAAGDENDNSGKSDESGGMKMPAGIPKVGKMPDWVKKRIEARKQAKKEGKKAVLPEVPQEEKDFSFAVLEIERTLKNVLSYKQLLESSPESELQGFLHALNGGYIAPSPGGDVVLSPNTLPTGRNMYSINAEATPGTRAWDNGKALAEATLHTYFKKHEDWPRKVSYTFWAGEFIETEGATLAQALYMLGVEPVRDGMGRVTDIRLIPSEELKRPRIDIVVQTSGQLRDLAASRLAMLSKAVAMAAKSEGDQYGNYVAEGTVESEKRLVEKGISPKEARELSTMRIFGAVNGGYGTGITGLVEKGDAWEKESQIADTYLNNMGAIYGDPDKWGEVVKDLFEVALQNTDVVMQPRQSNTWGALSLDHMYEFMGGLNLSVRNVTGKDPEAYLSDYRNRHNIRLQNLREAIGVESRTTLLNPEYIKEKMKGGATTAENFSKTFRNTYGWNVMKPSTIDNELWDDLYKMYVLDEQQLGIHNFFRKESPAALEEMTAVMLETARKGYWKATNEQLQQIAKLHTNLVNEFKPACTGFVCDNDKLKEFIASHTSTEQARTYQRNITAIKEALVETGQQVVLKKDQLTQQPQTESQTLDGILTSVTVMALFVMLVFILKRRKK